MKKLTSKRAARFAFTHGLTVFFYGRTRWDFFGIQQVETAHTGANSRRKYAKMFNRLARSERPRYYVAET